jgi:chemotaxis protein CheY-P-specific phosphatase CheC
MSKLNETILTESLVEALETMAFMSPSPPEETMQAPAESVLVTIRFDGPQEGAIELLAGTNFTILMAANIMGEDINDPQVMERGIDALKELLNTTCGIIVPKLADSPKDVYNISIPQAQPIISPEQWENYVVQPGAILLNVDGNPLMIKSIKDISIH